MSEAIQIVTALTF